MKKIFNELKRTFSDRVVYYNDKGEIHRLDGPAVEYTNGDKYWYINGKLHREDGPAVVFYNGTKWWYLNGIRYMEYQFHQELIKLKLKRLIEL